MGLATELSMLLFVSLNLHQNHQLPANVHLHYSNVVLEDSAIESAQDYWLLKFV